jgi:hypothetical protein
MLPSVTTGQRQPLNLPCLILAGGLYLRGWHCLIAEGKVLVLNIENGDFSRPGELPVEINQFECPGHA